MIGKSFRPPGSTQEWWDAWMPRAEKATWRAIDAFEAWFAKNDGAKFDCELDDSIWKEVKEWYIANIFPRKCAYCESRFARVHGDAEHYRPKSSVKCKGANGKYTYPTCTVPDPSRGGAARAIRHPGYFWLAYDWRNLIPACTMCNSGLGKNDRFEITKEFVVLKKLLPEEFEAIPEGARPRESRRWPGYFYPSPQMLDVLEDPLLLNPLNPLPDKDPRKHLRFGERGIVTSIDQSRYGEVTIDVLQLDKGDLPSDRAEAQGRFQDDLLDLLRKKKLDEWKPLISAYLDPFRNGERPYSAAALDYYPLVSRQFVELLNVMEP